MMFIGLGILGAMTGWFYAFSTSGDLFLYPIIFGIVFLVFAAIPVTLVLRTFDIVYVTLLYVFIRRKEGDISGRTAIPSAMGQELDRAYNRAQNSQ
jgi:hypothetical protein